MNIYKCRLLQILYFYQHGRVRVFKEKTICYSLDTFCVVVSDGTSDTVWLCGFCNNNCVLNIQQFRSSMTSKSKRSLRDLKLETSTQNQDQSTGYVYNDLLCYSTLLQ